jgi:hypothetical protein
MKGIDTWIAIPIMGIIAVTIINAVRTGVDTSGWDTASIVIASLLGVIVLARVIMRVLGVGQD